MQLTQFVTASDAKARSAYGTNLSRREIEILEELSEVSRAQVAPSAHAADIGKADLARVLRTLARTGALGTRVPAQLGGTHSGGVAHVHANEIVARDCATTAFLLQQHTGATALVARGQPSPTRDQALRTAATGESLLGIAASHLRKPGSGIRATAVDGGYELNGASPWVSGYGIMSDLLIGAEAESGPAHFIWLPFESAAGLTLTPITNLSVMRGTNTVRLECSGFFVPESAVVARDHSAYFAVRHGGFLAAHGAFALGCGCASIESFASSPPGAEFAELAREVFSGQRLRFYAGLERLTRERDETILDELLACRVDVCRLAIGLACAEVAAAGGRAHVHGHPANRRLREAAFFSTSTVTPDFGRLLLSELVRCNQLR